MALGQLRVDVKHGMNNAAAVCRFLRGRSRRTGRETLVLVHYPAPPRNQRDGGGAETLSVRFR